jgi:cation:H+ antiporter
MMTYVLFLLGFVALVTGAVFLIDGARNIARKFHVSEMVVGLTIVSIGTSMPELVVSSAAGLSGHADLAVANLLGSNIANVLLILGVAALIRALPVTDATVLSEIPFSLIAALLVGFLANAALFTTSTELTISHIDGGILLFFFGLFLLYVYKMSKDRAAPRHTEATRDVGLARSWLLVALGIFALYLGGQWVVAGAIKIARYMGYSESMIGLSIVAVGTSLPELVASAVAARRGNTDIAVGNVVGSNIFNMLWVLGLTAVITDLPFDVVGNTDLAMVIFSTTMVIVAVVLGRKGTIERWHGIAFILTYIAYLAFLIDRG